MFTDLCLPNSLCDSHLMQKINDIDFYFGIFICIFLVVILSGSP